MSKMTQHEQRLDCQKQLKLLKSLLNFASEDEVNKLQEYLESLVPMLQNRKEERTIDKLARSIKFASEQCPKELEKLLESKLNSKEPS